MVFPTSELDLEVFPSSKAFSPQVAIFRLPSPAWCAVPVIQPIILMLCVFASGALCSLVLIFSSMAMLAVGIVCHLMFRPQRVLLSNIVQGLALILNSAMLIISSLLVDDPIHSGYVEASRSIAKVQITVTVLQISHDLGVALYMYVFAPGALLPSKKAIFTSEGVLTRHRIDEDEEPGQGRGSGSLNYYFWGRGRGVGSPQDHHEGDGDAGGAVVVVDREIMGGEGGDDICEELLQGELLLGDEE